MNLLQEKLKTHPLKPKHLIKKAQLYFRKPDKIAVLLFLLYFIVGLLIFPSYGISTDEPMERETSMINLHYAMESIFGARTAAASQIPVKTSLLTYEDRYYGTALQTIPLMVEYLFGFDLSTRTVFLIRHLFTFINYYTAGIFFFLILRRRFNTYIPLLGALLYILYPRFFGESFYNIKDILFFSWAIISSYFVLQWLLSKKLKHLIFAAVTIAVAANTRILGFAILLLACGFSVIIEAVNKKDDKSIIRYLKKFKEMLKLIALTYVFYIIITPFLWENPLGNTIAQFVYFRELDQLQWNDTHLYLGKMITQYVQYHYIPVWMSVTIPLLHIIAFSIGAIVLTWKMISYIMRAVGQKRLILQALTMPHIYDLFFFSMFMCTYLGFVFFKITMYEGWRHAYMIYCPFLYVAVLGLSKATFFCKRYALLHKAFLLFVALNLIYLLGFIALNHPYQYAYFNIVGRQAEGNFSIDFWNVSSYDLIRYAIEDADNCEISICIQRGTYAFHLLTQNEKKLVRTTRNVDDAEYYIYGTRGAWYSLVPPGFTQIKEITSGGVTISALYKRTAEETPHNPP
ncbi:MAG: glycosyltransferase family 39 protein [Oscillospiraceae bacterium]|nr:glycosyltransferase family 39 protein [Oscillospiraceae bacterium]